MPNPYVYRSVHILLFKRNHSSLVPYFPTTQSAPAPPRPVAEDPTAVMVGMQVPEKVEMEGVVDFPCIRTNWYWRRIASVTCNSHENSPVFFILFIFFFVFFNYGVSKCLEHIDQKRVYRFTPKNWYRIDPMWVVKDIFSYDDVKSIIETDQLNMIIRCALSLSLFDSHVFEHGQL